MSECRAVRLPDTASPLTYVLLHSCNVVFADNLTTSCPIPGNHLAKCNQQQELLQPALQRQQHLQTDETSSRVTQVPGEAVVSWSNQSKRREVLALTNGATSLRSAQEGGAGAATLLSCDVDTARLVASCATAAATAAALHITSNKVGHTLTHTHTHAHTHTNTHTHTHTHMHTFTAHRPPIVLLAGLY